MDKIRDLEDPQELTEHSRESLRDLLEDNASYLSSNRKTFTREQLVSIIKCLINDLQVEVYTLENTDAE